MAINAAWHANNRMPANPSFEQRVAWHQEHQKRCGCRPLPRKLAEEMRKRGLPKV